MPTALVPHTSSWYASEPHTSHTRVLARMPTALVSHTSSWYASELHTSHTRVLARMPTALVPHTVLLAAVKSLLQIFVKFWSS